MTLSLSLIRLARFASPTLIKGSIEDRAAKQHYANLLEKIREGEDSVGQAIEICRQKSEATWNLQHG